MVKTMEFVFEDPTLFDEDQDTLDAIDEGLCDARNGRTVPAEEVRKLLPQWIAARRS